MNAGIAVVVKGDGRGNVGLSVLRRGQTPGKRENCGQRPLPGALDTGEMELLGKKIVNAAAGIRARKQSQKEIGEWAAHLLGTNSAMSNHSC